MEVKYKGSSCSMEFSVVWSLEKWDFLYWNYFNQFWYTKRSLFLPSFFFLSSFSSYDFMQFQVCAAICLCVWEFWVGLWPDRALPYYYAFYFLMKNEEFLGEKFLTSTLIHAKSYSSADFSSSHFCALEENLL